MIIKTTELTARALDWAVEVAVGKEMGNVTNGMQLTASVDSMPWVHEPYSPTTNWGQLGPLLAECMHYCKRDDEEAVVGVQMKDPQSLMLMVSYGSGVTLEIAACRAIVYSKLGDQVDVPEVLL